MITVHVKEMCEKRGITTAYQLQRGLEISPSVAARLYAGAFERVDLTTLDRMCKLLKCKTGDLLRYVPDGGG